jgi:hypothetical protein
MFENFKINCFFLNLIFAGKLFAYFKRRQVVRMLASFTVLYYGIRVTLWFSATLGAQLLVSRIVHIILIMPECNQIIRIRSVCCGGARGAGGDGSRGGGQCGRRAVSRRRDLIGAGFSRAHHFLPFS